MNFLAPLFLLGAAAVIGPVIYHLVRRTTRDRQRFSSLLFLQASPPRLAQRQRIEHWLLLLLRCLALLLLVLGFARPFFPSETAVVAAADTSRGVVVLVDVSASMRRSGVWAQARAKAEAALRSLAPKDRAELMVFAAAPRTLFSADDWERATPDARIAAGLARLSAVEPSYEGTNLGAALVAAADRLNESTAGRSVSRKEVIVISDFQVGARLDALQTQEWPREVAVRVQAVAAAGPTNAGLQLVSAGDLAGRGEIGALRVRVSNSPESKREEFQVGWAGSEGTLMGTAVTAYVPPGQSRIVRLPAAPAASAAARVVLRGDDDDFDNTLHVIPPVRRTAQVLWFGREGLEDPKGAGYFLRRALSDTPALAVQVESGGLEVPVGRARPDLAVVSGVLSESAVSTVRDWLSSGATVLAVADNTECGSTLARLAGQNEVRLTEANVEGYAMLGEIDFRHPLFSAFADPRFNDFTKIRFWRHRVIDPTSLGAARVLARFDRGSPAVLEVTVGQGRLYVLTAGWTPADSQLALSSKFVPLLWSLLEIAGARADAPAQLSVGDTLPLTKGHGGGVLSGPTATTRAVAVDAPVLGPFMEPGVYEWTSGGRTERFAVNLDPAESRTSPLNREQLEERGLPLASATDTSSRPKAEAERLADPIIEARQKIWRWALVAALLALALEMALAGRTTRIDFEKEISRA